jgi:hypothetical protein
MARSLGPAAMLFAGLAFVAGCGPDEKLYDVSGTVTFDGRPIPKGLIFFDPAPGTPGTQGFATIEDGRFDTAAPDKGRGIRGGAYLIRISGFDGKEGPEAPFGQALFPEHELSRDLPAQDQTFEYAVKRKR